MIIGWRPICTCVVVAGLRHLRSRGRSRSTRVSWMRCISSSKIGGVGVDLAPHAVGLDEFRGREYVRPAWGSPRRAMIILAAPRRSSDVSTYCLLAVRLVERIAQTALKVKMFPGAQALPVHRPRSLAGPIRAPRPEGRVLFTASSHEQRDGLAAGDFQIAQAAVDNARGDGRAGEAGRGHRHRRRQQHERALRAARRAHLRRPARARPCWSMRPTRPTPCS